VRVIAISGSPRSPSKSRTLAEYLLKSFERIDCETRLVDVATLPAEALLARTQHEEIDRAVAAVGAAHIVVASTPTYRALYTGALKCFFDLMPPSHLLGKICIPLQTGAAAEHALSPDYGLRPLFASLEGVSLAGVYATDAEFVDGEPSDEVKRRIVNIATAALTLARTIHGR
jgi:FMN reductase